jgi:hypothetical protein
MVPGRNDKCFVVLWRKATLKIRKTNQRGFNSAVILGAWTLWNHRNKCIFDGISPLTVAQHLFKDEMSLWCFAGACKLRELFFGRGVSLV